MSSLPVTAMHTPAVGSMGTRATEDATTKVKICNPSDLSLWLRGRGGGGAGAGGATWTAYRSTGNADSDASQGTPPSSASSPPEQQQQQQDAKGAFQLPPPRVRHPTGKTEKALTPMSMQLCIYDDDICSSPSSSSVSSAASDNNQNNATATMMMHRRHAPRSEESSHSSEEGDRADLTSNSMDSRSDPSKGNNSGGGGSEESSSGQSFSVGRRTDLTSNSLDSRSDPSKSGRSGGDSAAPPSWRQYAASTPAYSSSGSASGSGGCGDMTSNSLDSGRSESHSRQKPAGSSDTTTSSSNDDHNNINEPADIVMAVPSTTSSSSAYPCDDSSPETLAHCTSKDDQQATPMSSRSSSDSDENNKAYSGHVTALPGSILIIDMRSAWQFKQSHIYKASVHICLPTLFLKRASYGVTRIEASLESKTQKALFRQRQAAKRIVFIGAERAATMPASVLLLKEKLVRGGCDARRMHWLGGGYNSFRTEYPLFCFPPQSEEEKKANHQPLSLGALRNRDALLRGLEPVEAISASSKTLQHHVRLALSNSSDGGGSDDSAGSYKLRPHTDSSVQEYSKPIEILPYLFLSNECVARQPMLLEACGIDHVFVVGRECEAPTEEMLSKFKYYRMDLVDNDAQDLSGVYEDAFNIIEYVRSIGSRVLIHCIAGRSRSVSLVLMYVMKKFNWSLQQAYQAVRGKQPSIAPSFHFLGQLMNLESRLKATTTNVKLVDGAATVHLAGAIFESSMSPTLASPTESEQEGHQGYFNAEQVAMFCASGGASGGGGPMQQQQQRHVMAGFGGKAGLEAYASSRTPDHPVLASEQHMAASTPRSTLNTLANPCQQPTHGQHHRSPSRSRHGSPEENGEADALEGSEGKRQRMYGNGRVAVSSAFATDRFFFAKNKQV